MAESTATEIRETSGANPIEDCAVEGKHNHIESAHFGEHNLLVYPNIDTFREIYCMYAKIHLESNSEILMIVTQYESIEGVRNNLQTHGVDAGQHETNGSLVIVDSVKGYHGGDVNGIVKLARSLVARAEKEGKKGVCVFGDMGSFFMFDKIIELLQYELSIPARLGISLKAFCSYHMEDYNKLSAEQKRTVENAHHRKIFSPDISHVIGSSKGALNRAKILELIGSRPLNANQIASELNLDYKTVIHHLRVLIESGLLITENRSYAANYFLSPKMVANFDSYSELIAQTKKDN